MNFKLGAAIALLERGVVALERIAESLERVEDVAATMPRPSNVQHVGPSGPIKRRRVDPWE